MFDLVQHFRLGKIAAAKYFQVKGIDAYKSTAGND